MLRGIVTRAMAGRRATATARPRPRPATGRAGAGSADREIERGAKSLVRGLGRKRRGL